MDKLVYVVYPALAVVLLWGCKINGNRKWNDGFLSLSQTKALQGFCALCVMLHHVGQKTCANWLNPSVIRPGLELFVPIGYLFVSVFLFCSGYGLYKSYQTKPNYLNHFLRKRVLLIVLSFYSTAYLFLIVRFLMGERFDAPRLIYFLTGAKLSNPNSWYVIALPIFYLGFYFAFKHCKSDKLAILMTCLVVFAYTMIGTFTNHNDFWMRGEWWYNSVHLFSIGLLFARFEQTIIPKVKKYYLVWLVILIVLFVGFYQFSNYAQNAWSYYGENFNANNIVLRRWGCLLTQMGASTAFVFIIFMLGMKIQIGNKALSFMGSITLEFYLIHGLYVELFGYSFLDMVPGIYDIKNVAAFVAVVLILGILTALLLRRFHQWVMARACRRIE